VAQDFLKGAREGRFFRGNLHGQSDRSDGLLGPEGVVSAYRDAGYDVLCLSDHFEEGYGWRLTDTRRLRDEELTTILGAELSSAPRKLRDCYWVTAAGPPRTSVAPDGRSRRGHPAGRRPRGFRRDAAPGAQQPAARSPDQVLNVYYEQAGFRPRGRRTVRGLGVCLYERAEGNGAAE
jgi:hypothetical protein